jgi:hypothetical protein
MEDQNKLSKTLSPILQVAAVHCSIGEMPIPALTLPKEAVGVVLLLQRGIHRAVLGKHPEDKIILVLS